MMFDGLPHVSRSTRPIARQGLMPQRNTTALGKARTIHWLVVLTILKNTISQWEGLSHILWKIKNVPNHQPVQNCDSLPVAT